MGKIVLKKLHFNKNLEIKFNNTENYIIGNNATGKTTLFNLIQYILGLKNRTSQIGFLKMSDSPYLECQFGNKEVRFKRELNSRKVIVEGDVSAEFYANSKELNELYSNLLDIKFFPTSNQKSVLDILKFSFFSAFDFKHNNLLGNETYHQIIGYNPEYLKLIQKDINNLNSQVDLESQSMSIVEKYKKALEASFNNSSHLDFSKDIKYILDSEFFKISDNFRVNFELLQNAKSIYLQEKQTSEKFIDEQLMNIEPFFYDSLPLTIKNKNLYNFRLKEIIDMKQTTLNGFSFSEKAILLFILRLTFCRDIKNIQYNNGLGLLVTDEVLAFSDDTSQMDISYNVNKVTQSGELQYINFCRDNSYIPREYIVYDMSPKQGGNLFER